MKNRTMDKREADYLYEVWRRGGNPDAVDLEEVPKDFDWVWDQPLPSPPPPSREEQNDG